jgi:NAD-dependent DNA ligase
MQPICEPKNKDRLKSMFRYNLAKNSNISKDEIQEFKDTIFSDIADLHKLTKYQLLNLHLFNKQELIDLIKHFDNNLSITLENILN